MQRILSLVLVISIFLGVALPVSALDGVNDREIAAASAESATDTELSEPEGNPPLGISGREEPAAAAALPDSLAMPMSGFVGEGSGFYTKIRLTVTDRGGNPVEGAVYGLYRTDNGMLVEELTSDRNGVATSGDVPAETDYYLLEHTFPEGFLSNEERRDILLTEVCAPSRVDVSVVYDPIVGQIHVIKEDEKGNRIAGVGFYAYRVDGWELVDTIYTDENGEAWTTDLPYSPNGYELYEFEAPEDFVTGGYHTVYITRHDEAETIRITNYRATGAARVYMTATDGRNVQGAVYSIHRYDGEWVCDITTNSSGYAYAYDLPMGDFYAVEKSVPSPCKHSDETQYFTLSSNGQWAYLEFVNEVQGEAGRLRLLKTDDGGNYLSGVVFGLYRAWDNKKLAELTTGGTGLAEYYPLIPQDYYLLEISGKDGYQMVTDRINFTVDGSGETVEIVVENPKIRVFGKVKAIMSDDAGNPVPGTRIGVYCKWGILLEELVIGEDGTATSGILNEGTGYYLMELEGMPGYLPSGEKYPFDITQNWAVVPVNIEKPRVSGGIRVTTYGWNLSGGENEETLASVTFGVYRDGRLVERLIIGGDGTATSGTLYYGDFELIGPSTVEGYELIDTPIPFSITEDGVILDIEVTNPFIMGTITVIKVDDRDPADDSEEDAGDGTDGTTTGRSLSGAVFSLYNEQGQKLAELVTGADGSASYTVPKGNYYLKELSAPEGFLLSDELIPFSIETQRQVVEKVAVNAQGHGIIQVSKSSDAGENSEPLPGVAFDLYREADDEKVGEIITSEDGTAALELPLGRYYLIETSTVEGFRLLSGRVSFALTGDGETVELHIANQRVPEPENGGILLTKTSAGNGALLPNTVFGVYDTATGEKVGGLVSGPDGTARVSLPASDYYLLEEAAPEGFLLSEIKIPVTVVEGEYAEITVENEPDEPASGELRVISHAAGTGERLPGARFGVYDATTDEKSGEIVTAENGVASRTLPEGDFYLLALEAPAGFLKHVEPFSFHITAGKTTKLIIANQPETPAEDTGAVRFIKKDEDEKRLRGAVIGVYRSGSNEKVAELTTDNAGVAKYTLAASDYYWKELRAPSGFVLLTDKHTFTVTKNETTEIVVVNEALPAETGRLSLTKKAAGTGKAIGDAVFGVYLASNNSKVAEITTDDSGEAEIALEPNRYYLKELSVPSPFVLESSKIHFTIKNADTTVTVEVSNTKGIGTLLLDKASTEGGPVAGAVFVLYRQDGTRVAELVSCRDGTATYELPVGNYYIEEKTAAVGFLLDTTRHSFTIKHGETRTVKVTNTPIEGTVEVYFKHVDDGRELSRMQSLTDKIGTDYIKWMREKGYENKLIDGYILLRTDYPSSLGLVDGTLVVTLWYGNPSSATGTIEIPKTGEPYPYMVYGLSLLCWMVAAFCGVTLYRRGKPVTQMAGVSDAMPEPEPEPPVEPTRTATSTHIPRQNANKSKKKRKKHRK